MKNLHRNSDTPKNLKDVFLRKGFYPIVVLKTNCQKNAYFFRVNIKKMLCWKRIKRPNSLM